MMMLLHYIQRRLQKDRVIEILNNLDNFKKSEQVDIDTLEDKDRISLEIGKRKENAFKNYLINYLKKYISMLSNGKLRNMEMEPEFDNFTFLKILQKVNIEKYLEKCVKLLKHFLNLNLLMV